MKKITYTGAGLVASGLVLAMFSACGGGGGGDSTPAVETAELTASSAEILAVNAAEALPGCSYTSETTVTASNAYASVYKSAIKTIVDDSEDSAESTSSATVRVTTINETTVGTCPIDDPGYYTKVGTHDSGVDDVVYTFVNYCLGDEVESVTVNGVADVKNVGEPSDTGPIPQYAEVSTGTDGIQVTEKGEDGTYTHIAKLDNLVYTFGNGDLDPTEDKPDEITADSLSILDGRSEDTFSVSNVIISGYTVVDGETTEDVLNIASLTYVDPETGAVNVRSTTPIIMNDADVITSGAIAVTGSNDATLTMSLSSTVTNGFDVIFDGEKLGIMDCSGLSNNIVLQ